MKRTAALIVSLLMFCTQVFAEEVGIISHEILESYNSGPSGTPQKIHKFTMTAGTNGACYSTTSSTELGGKLKVYWVDHDGTVTDNFDIMLVSTDTDKDEKDWLYGACLDLSSTNSSTANHGIPLNLQGGFIELPPGNYFTSGVGFGSTNTVYFYLTTE